MHEWRSSKCRMGLSDFQDLRVLRLGLGAIKSQFKNCESKTENQKP